MLMWKSLNMTDCKMKWWDKCIFQKTGAGHLSVKNAAVGTQCERKKEEIEAGLNLMDVFIGT